MKHIPSGILCLGDLHLTRLIRYFPEEKALELQFNALYKTLQIANELNVSDLVLLGDTFDDSNPPQNWIGQFILFLIEASKLYRIHIILGNHDLFNIEKHSLTTLQILLQAYILPNVTLYTRPTLTTIATHSCAMLPFPHGKLPKNKRIRFAFAHTDFAGTKYDNGFDSKIKLEVDISKKTTWIVGHLHVPQIYFNGKLIYPGSLGPLAHIEGSKKFLIHIDVNGKLIHIPFKADWQLEEIIVKKTADIPLARNENIAYLIKYEDNSDIEIEDWTGIFDVRPLKKKPPIISGADTDIEFDHLTVLKNWLHSQTTNKVHYKRALVIAKTLIYEPQITMG